MARSSALKQITAEAKRLKKKHPHRFDRLKKSLRWSGGYIKQASAIYASKHKGKSPVGKKKKRKKIGRTTARKPKGKHLVKFVEKSSTERVMSGRRKKVGKKKKCHCTHRVYMAGRRRRSVGSNGGSGRGMGLLVAAGIGIAALYFISKSKSTTTTTPTQLPPLTTTGNYTRNTQSQDLINYALAAGLAVDAISKIIDKLNNSSDQQVQTIYDQVSTTGDFTYLA